MSGIYSSITQLIGNTPLLELTGYNKKHNLNARILGKLEYFNPCGSVKDRIAKAMIEDAENRGILKKDSVIIEPTSGNTGIGLAAVAGSKGYKVILTMPQTMSIERRKLLKMYGAEIVLTDGTQGMDGAIKMAQEIAKNTPDSFIPDQFCNPSNPQMHKMTTGPEIWKDTDGKIDILVAGVGSGGTISGTGAYLKQMNKNIKIVAVEPFNSAVLSHEMPGSHGLQGIGAGFIPKNMDTDILDEIIKVKNESAFTAGKEIAKTDGILVGISSGAALFAAKELAERKENAGKIIVVILPDTGERYLSTMLFED